MSGGDIKLGKRESKQSIVHPVIEKSDGVGGQDINQK